MNQQVVSNERAKLDDSLPTAVQLLPACRAGNEEAWQHLLHQYAGWVYAVPLHYGLSSESATEITQIVFSALIQSLETLCDDSNVGGWLALVARRHTWRALRLHQPTAGGELLAESPAALFPEWRNPGEPGQAPLPSLVHDLLMQRFIDHVQCRRQSNLFQRRRAALTFDSLHQPLPTGLRAIPFDITRQYVFAIATLDVALNIQPCWYGAHLDLTGQILPNRPDLITDVFVAQLLHDDQEIAITLSDPVGGFGFEALAPGAYTLLLSTNRLEIEMPGFALAYG